MASMATHVALLRGINVGGRNKVPMAGLREVATARNLATSAKLLSLCEEK
jgi:uncharacterized protein (DUF1697 family)